jgi:hypothetical protein
VCEGALSALNEAVGKKGGKKERKKKKNKKKQGREEEGGPRRNKITLMTRDKSLSSLTLLLFGAHASSYGISQLSRDEYRIGEGRASEDSPLAL